MNAKQESPKPSDKLVVAENNAKPVEKLETPAKKARASLSSNAQAPVTPKVVKNVNIYFFLFYRRAEYLIFQITLATALMNSAKKKVSIKLEHNKAQGKLFLKTRLKKQISLALCQYEYGYSNVQ